MPALCDEPWLFLPGQGLSYDFEEGYNRGAAVAFGLMGMAEAIRSTYLCGVCRCNRIVWTKTFGRVCSFCESTLVAYDAERRSSPIRSTAEDPGNASRGG